MKNRFNRRAGRDWLPWFAAAVFVLAVAAAVSALELKRTGLAFHQRDYPYFVEMAAKMADPRLTNRYATNIEGYNLVGLQGIEGVQSIYQAIHSEYYRLINVGLYALFKDALPLYLVYSIFYFAPVLYAAWVWRRAGAGAKAPLVLFILLYILFPGAIPTAASDLRSRMLYIAAWSLAVTVVVFERPFLEKLVWLAFLPFIREEGILLGGIVTVLNFIQMRGKPGRARQTIVFGLLLAAALAAFFAFMAWGGYRRIDYIYNPLTILRKLFSSPLIWGGLIAAGGAALALARAARRRPDGPRIFFFWLAYSAVIALGVLQLGRDFAVWYGSETLQGPVSAWQVYLRVITWEQTSLLYGAVILPVLFLGRATARVKRIGLRAAAALLAVMALTSAYALPLKLSAWRARIEPARLVWEFKAGHDPYATRLLVDYATLQAFYDYETVVVYNRLPVWMVYPNVAERFYPQNKKLAARAISEGLEYAVIARRSLENVAELAGMAGRETSVVAQNSDYVVLRFH